MATCLFERDWRRRDYSLELRGKIVQSKIRKILNRKLTFAEEVLLRQVAILLLESDKLEHTYADTARGNDALDKNYLSIIGRIDHLFLKLGLTKRAKDTKKSEQEFDFSKVLNGS